MVRKNYLFIITDEYEWVDYGYVTPCHLFSPKWCCHPWMSQAARQEFSTRCKVNCQAQEDYNQSHNNWDWANWWVDNVDKTSGLVVYCTLYPLIGWSMVTPLEDLNMSHLQVLQISNVYSETATYERVAYSGTSGSQFRRTNRKAQKVYNQH